MIQPSRVPDAQNAERMKDAIREGPVSLSFGVSDDFMMYSSGIYTGTCHGWTNHAMVGVGFGYDEETGLEFINIMNSWGPWWGDNGYIRVAMGVAEEGGNCLVLESPEYPILA